MRKLLLASALVLAATQARADVILDPHLSGTGDNVVFDSIASPSEVLGSLNGQHTNVVDFTDLSSTPGFTGAANGNDIKIDNTSDLQVVVFDSTDTVVVGTTDQVFSLKGTGDVHLTVTASDGVFNFDLGQIDPNMQSGFTLTAVNGEVMTKLVIDDVTPGGMITDFEHYRIDVAPLAVPGPVAGAGLSSLLGGLGLLGLAMVRRVRAPSL